MVRRSLRYTLIDDDGTIDERFLESYSELKKAPALSACLFCPHNPRTRLKEVGLAKPSNRLHKICRSSSWITFTSQAPSRGRYSHTLLPNRDLGNRLWTRKCLQTLVPTSRTRGFQQSSRPTAVGTRGQGGRERITSQSNMAAVTTLTIRRKHRIPFRMTRTLSECECSRPPASPLLRAYPSNPSFRGGERTAR